MLESPIPDWLSLPSQDVQKAGSFFPQAFQTHRLVTMKSQRPGSLASHISNGLCNTEDKAGKPSVSA